MEPTNANDDAQKRKVKFKELLDGYHLEVDGKDKWVDMSQKTTCRYYKTDENGKKTKDMKITVIQSEASRFEAEREHGLTSSYISYSSIPTEDIVQQSVKRHDCALMGITLRQLRAVMANVNRRCEDENWADSITGKLLVAKEVTMRHVTAYVVKPFTMDEKHKQYSFVQNLPSCAGPQKPRFIASHSMDMPLCEFIDCFSQFVKDFSRNSSKLHDVKGGGMTADTPIWVFTFAVNQWESNFEENELASRLARKYAEYRTISFLDRDRTLFQRMWCIYDVYQSVQNDRNAQTFWCIYTPFEHEDDNKNIKKSVGIVPGGAPSDHSPSEWLNREKYFPIDVIVKIMGLQVQDCIAPKSEEKNLILNAMIQGKSIGSLLLEVETKEMAYAQPPETSEKYDKVNDSIRAHFATLGALKIALNSREDELWKELLQAMSKGNLNAAIKLDFKQDGGWERLDIEKAIELISSLPKTVTRLEIYNSGYGPKFIEALAKWIEITSANLKDLVIQDTFRGRSWEEDFGKKTISNLADALLGKKGTVIETLSIWGVDVTLVKYFVRNEHVAKALFSSIKDLYVKDGFDKEKCKVLYTAFKQCNISITEFAPDFVDSAIEWSFNVSKGDPFKSESGYFLKYMLNTWFTHRLNLAFIMLDFYVQGILVWFVSNVNIYYVDRKDNSINNHVVNILLCCALWLLFREIIQIFSTDTKKYILSFSNAIDLTQIFLIMHTFRVLGGADDLGARGDDVKAVHVAGIAVTWLAFTYELSNFLFPLAVFVTALEQIVISLVPFLFTTVLITVMFSHMYMAQYCNGTVPSSCKEELPVFVHLDDFEEYYMNETEIEYYMNETGIEFYKNKTGIEEKIWCQCLPQSYKISFAWFLSGDLWNFELSLTFAYAFVIGVLFFNIVIAVVSNRFTDVMNDAEHSFWMHRYSLIQDVYSIRSMFNTIFNKCLPKRKSKRKGHLNEDRFDFMDEASAMDFTMILQSDQGKNMENSKAFLDWWFSPLDPLSSPCAPTLSIWTRMKIFLNYSRWDDIIFPGDVFERICRGLRCEEDIDQKENDNTIKFCFVRIVIKILIIFLCILNAIAIILLFCVGIVTFGYAWPRPMTEFLFHAETAPPTVRKQQKEKDIILQEREKMHEEIEQLKSLIQKISRKEDVDE